MVLNTMCKMIGFVILLEERREERERGRIGLRRRRKSK